MQYSLPGMLSLKAYKDTLKFVRLRTMSLAEGIEYISGGQRERRIGKYIVENVAKGSATRLKLFAAGHTTCVACGLKGEHFHIERHKNDKVMPFSVNLYGWKGDREVMLTWDHILPKSLGGSDRIENGQCMCADCNRAKGYFLSINEIIEIVAHPNVEKMYKMLQQLPPLKDIVEQAKRV